MKTDLIENSNSLFEFKGDPSRERSDLEIENEDRVKAVFKYSPVVEDERFGLKTESFILEHAYAHNKILSLSNSRTRILAHQVESTYIIVNALKQRFLIADEVGLGKTIEAGLVIKELIYRYNHKRILIAAPASLLYQWQSEMKSKFNEDFTIMNRKLLKKAEKKVGEDGNPWLVHDKIICSMDFLKNDLYAEDLKNTKWDAVIFDECHRLRRDSSTSTKVYSAAEIISENTDALLLLSATPFRGKIEELYYLIALVDKNVLGPFRSFSNEYCHEGADVSRLKEKLSSVVIRRTKKEIGGFTSRFASTIKFELYPDERLLYDETTRYVAEEFNRAIQTENRAVGFVMTVFQKLLDSSSHALFSALRNRLNKLNSAVERAEEGARLFEEASEQFDYSEIEDSENSDELMDVPVEKTISELKEEIKTLKRLVKLAGNVGENKKGEKLLQLIKSLKKKGIKKFLIFTQFRTTQDYLADILSDYDTIVFNGSMSGEEKEDAIFDFKDRAEILIATEAGGEGRNMQFCNIIINYDLPWSPLKIEQRIGRLHRFGQPDDVFIYNFSTAGTVAERILEVLTTKLKLFEESIGAPDIMLGQFEDELKLNNLFMDMVSQSKKKKEIESEIDERIEAARKSYEKIGDLTVAHRMDFNYDEYYRITLKERAFSNRRIEKLISSIVSIENCPVKYIGSKDVKNDLYPIKIDKETFNIKGDFGTFDSAIALEDESLEFLAFGHPIVDDIKRFSQSEAFGGESGIICIKHNIKFTCLLINYIVTFESVADTSELIPVIIDPNDLLDEFDVKDIEREAIGHNILDCSGTKANLDEIEKITRNADFLFYQASERLKTIINDKIFDMSMNLDLHIDPELEKIHESYDKSLKELNEKLEIQLSRMKWYGKDMKGAITRTQNRILKVRREKETLIEKLKSYSGIKYSVKMLNAGVVISK